MELPAVPILLTLARKEVLAMQGDPVRIRMTIELDAEDLARLGSVLAPVHLAASAVPAPAAQTADRLLGTAETAEILGISKSSLYGLRYVGDAPPAIKVGSRLRWRRVDVERWMDENLEERPAPRW